MVVIFYSVTMKHIYPTPKYITNTKICSYHKEYKTNNSPVESPLKNTATSNIIIRNPSYYYNEIHIDMIYIKISIFCSLFSTPENEGIQLALQY